MKVPKAAIKGNDQSVNIMSIIIGGKYLTVDSADDITKRLADRLNIIRFLAICSIIWGHSTFLIEHQIFTNTFDQYLQSALIQCGKIGTIFFFMISGFFLAGQIQRFNLLSYLKYRLSSLIVPWLIFISAAALIQTGQTLAVVSPHSITLTYVIKVIADYYIGVIFYGAYWFIPVSIFSSLIFIQFKKHANSMWVGASLAAITLFYSINLHYSWISTNHTKAFLGYSFFIWLGIQVKNNIHKVASAINKFNWYVLIPLATVFFIAACAEGFKLKGCVCTDAYASIRITNILLCAVLFLMMLKSTRMGSIDKLDPKGKVYAMYLLHSVIIICLFPILKYDIVKYHLFNNLPKLLIVQFAFFATILLVTYSVVSLLKRSVFSVVIGSKPVIFKTIKPKASKVDKDNYEELVFFRVFPTTLV